MRTVGVISRGIRAPIIREGDDLASIVTECVVGASREAGFAFHDRDVGRAAGDIKRAGKALEAVQRSGVGRHGKDPAIRAGSRKRQVFMMTSRTENVGCCRNSGKRAGRVASDREHRQRAGACAWSGTTAARPESISGHIIQERCRKAAGGWAASYLGGIARKGLALSGSRQDHPFPAHMPERTDLPTGVRRMRQQKRICMVTSSHCRPKAACSQ